MARASNIYIFQHWGGAVMAAFTVKHEAYSWLRRNGAKTPDFARGLSLFRVSDGDRWPDSVPYGDRRIALPLEEK